MHLIVDMCLVRRATMHLEGEPKLERVHAPRPLHGDFEVVERYAGNRLRHVRCGHPERCLHSLRTAGEDNSCDEGHCQPLMGIDGYGVAPFDAADQVPIAIAECHRCTVSAVEMKPQAFAL